MSVRAYRVITRDVADDSSFNLWHDQKVMDYLEEQPDVHINLTDDGGGTIEIPRSILEVMLKKAKKLELDEYHIKAMKSDIVFAKKHKDDYVLYECY